MPWRWEMSSACRSSAGRNRQARPENDRATPRNGAGSSETGPALAELAKVAVRSLDVTDSAGG